MNQKLRFFASEAYTTLCHHFWAKLGYSRIKIDHIADSLLKLQIKIGGHLINVELSQLLTLVVVFEFDQSRSFRDVLRSITDSNLRKYFMKISGFKKFKFDFQRVWTHCVLFYVLTYTVGEVSELTSKLRHIGNNYDYVPAL